MTNRAGTLVANLSGEMEYKSFLPAPLPPNPPVELSSELLGKLLETNSKVSALEALSSRITDMDLFISMYVRKEALLSSQIEGTQCTLEDVLDPNVENNTLPSRQKSTALKVFSYLEANPIMDTQKTAKALGLSYNTIAKAVSTLCNIGILQHTSKSGKANIYSYTQYLDILRQGT